MLGRTIGAAALLSVCLVLPVAAQQPTDPAAGKTDHAAAVKESLQKSMAALRQYQWVETTVVSVKGEEKSRTQATCYYGADGKVQKLPSTAPAEEKKKRGLRGQIAKNKKKDMSEAMNEAVALVSQYVPPDPARIQAAMESGRLSVTPPNSQGQVQVAIKDFIKTGDSLTLDVNNASDRISSVTVASFTEKAKDAVGLKVQFGAFEDGTVYPAKVQLEVAAEKLAVVIENSGYKKTGG
jgi:hypothetical protein